MHFSGRRVGAAVRLSVAVGVPGLPRYHRGGREEMAYVIKVEGPKGATCASVVQAGELEGLGDGLARCVSVTSGVHHAVKDTPFFHPFSHIIHAEK